MRHKWGIGTLLFLELRERLLSVGIRTLLCWGDRESEEFLIKQGFMMIGKANKKGRNMHGLPIKAGVRRALCFPGCSTLMASHIFMDSSFKAMELSLPPLKMKHPVLTNLTVVQDPCKEVEHPQWTGSGCSESKQLGLENFSNDVQGATKRIWETSSTSLKSKKVKGIHSHDCQVAAQCPVWTSDGSVVNFYDITLKSFSEHKLMPDASLANSGNKNTCEKYKQCRAGNMPISDYSCWSVPPTKQCVKIMLTNIADDDKRLSLTQIIEDLGGVVTSNGSESTHVVTGKARKTLNFCIALCSGCWVISAAWLKESFRKGIFVDEMPYILKDDDYVAKYRCELKCSVFRAKANPNMLLKGLIYGQQLMHNLQLVPYQPLLSQLEEM